jgi:hypothetical protein
MFSSVVDLGVINCLIFSAKNVRALTLIKFFEFHQSSSGSLAAHAEVFNMRRLHTLDDDGENSSLFDRHMISGQIPREFQSCERRTVGKAEEWRKLH